jgi:hypothetical protein
MLAKTGIVSMMMAVCLKPMIEVTKRVKLYFGNVLPYLVLYCQRALKD